MSDTIRDLYEWYPLLPWNLPQNNDALKNILDIRLVIQIPAGDRYPGTGIAGVAASQLMNAFSVVLTSIDETTATFMIRGRLNKTMQSDAGVFRSVSVPVLKGRDSTPTVSSYVVVDADNPPTWVSTNELVCVHPNALLFLQETPSIKFRDRPCKSVTSDDAVGNDTANYALANDYVLTPMAFADGFNVAVMAETGTIRFLCGSALGRGLYREPPYSDVDTYATAEPVGLRSINGLYGNVDINGTGSVLVNISTDQIQIQRATSSE